MRELITAKDISIQTKIVANQISDDLKGDKTPVVMIGLLKGCFMFYADLIRNMQCDVECDFMRVKSYISKNTQCDIIVTKHLDTPITGKHVYIVDDIYDTGNTVNSVIEYLKVKNPASISIVTLVARDISPVPKQKSYHAFTIGDEWLIGYGMDDDRGLNRNLPSIWVV